MSVDILSTQEIAEALGIPTKRPQKRLWRAGIQPTKVIDRTNLYPRSVLRRLRSEDRVPHSS